MNTRIYICIYVCIYVNIHINVSRIYVCIYIHTHIFVPEGSRGAGGEERTHLNHQPETTNPKPQTLNPKPQTLNPIDFPSPPPAAAPLQYPYFTPPYTTVLPLNIHKALCV